MKRDPERYTTTDGKPPHPEYDMPESPAPQPVDPETGQHRAYWVLSESERAKGFVRPVRSAYVHAKRCKTVTTMGRALSETYAREPKFYGSTFCCHCGAHYPVAEFTWDPDGQIVGS